MQNGMKAANKMKAVPNSNKISGLIKDRDHWIRRAALKQQNINMRILVIIAVAQFDTKDRNDLTS
jgi:hypothetical protein